MKPTFENKIALIVIVFCFGFLYLAYFFKPVGSDNGVTIGVVGFIGTILGYYFGSSRGSTKKDEVLSTALTGKDENAASITETKTVSTISPTT